MIYPNLFASYDLHGRDWLKTIPPDDLRVFVMIGFQASDYGRKGGRALAKKRGHKGMSELGRRGALVVNMRKWFMKRIKEESEKELGL